MVEGLSLLPNEIVSVLCESLLEIAEHEFGADEYIKNHRSLGVEKVLNLYKSKRKGRRLDQNPFSHKLTNYLYVLPEAERVEVAKHSNPLISSVFDYLRLCLENQAEPNLKHIVQLSKSYVESGQNGIQEILSAFHTEFTSHASYKQKINYPLLKKTMAFNSSYQLKSDNTGMKVSAETPGQKAPPKAIFSNVTSDAT
jgi:hypothetical protein